MARVSTSVALEKIGKGFGVASSAIGIIDGFRTLSEAGVMARRGELSSRVKTKTFLGGISIAGGVLAIACGSLVLIPAVIGLMTLVGAYMLVQLVPLNIRTWLRRSLYGIEQESVIGEPFKSSEEEMSSLQMVMQGIAVEIDVLEHRDTWQGMLEEAAEVNAGAYHVNGSLFKKELVKLSILAPSEISSTLEFSVKTNVGGGLETVENYQINYINNRVKNITLAMGRNDELDIERSSTTDFPIINNANGNKVVTWEYRLESNVRGASLLLYYRSGGLIANDTFLIF